MIAHKYKCIFVEVPKTGSSSIRAIIGKPPKAHLNLWQIKYELEHHWTRSRGIVNRFGQGCYLMLPEKQRMELGEKCFQTYFKFGFVRNPWDRVVSLYERKEGLQLKSKMSFDDFINWIQYSSSTCVHPVPHRYQLDWFVDPHGNILADFIGRFERLEEDWRIVADKLRIDKGLPHKNTNPRKKHYTDYYTDRTRQIIHDRFRVDIEHFGYAFGT